MMGFDTEKVLSDLPRLRRYAALMCANDKVLGDQAVELALNDLVARPDVLVGQDDYRPHLFRVLQLKLATLAPETIVMASAPRSCEGRGKSSGAALADEVLACLLEMPVEQRSALLLIVIEKLSFEHAGYALGTTPAIVRALLADARIHLQPEPSETSKTA